MRLICPNCDAQYEVDAGMIPASGRDVQCSNCGRTWFQGPDGTEPVVLAPEPDGERSGHGLDERAKAFFEGRSFEEPEAEEEPERQITAELAADQADGWDEEADADDDPAPTDERPVEAPHEEEIVAEPVAASEEDEDEPLEAPEIAADSADTDPVDEIDEEVQDDDGGEPELPRRRPDSHVLGILRAEAEREIAARRAEEAEAMESQPDLGALEPTPPRPTSAETEARTARLRGTEDSEADAATRKSMLPDIDDINATLTSTKDRRVPEMPALNADEIATRRTGFRIGFTGAMGTVVALIFLYLYAPELAAAVPTLEGTLAAYVDWANGMRLSLDAVLANTVDRLTGVAGETGGEG